MPKTKIVVVIPTVRPEQYKSFITAWKEIFLKHSVTLVTVWDDETPRVEVYNYDTNDVATLDYQQSLYQTHKHLIYRYTDACRNLGFIVAAQLNPDYVLTLDDDVAPLPYSEAWPNRLGDGRDPIQSHIDTLNKKVPLEWMNTAHIESPYLRGVPYRCRDEAQIMLSHGVWVGTPDFDGETQLKLEKMLCPKCNGEGRRFVNDPSAGLINYAAEETCQQCVGTGEIKCANGVPYSLPYYVGPIPKGVLFPLCGMNVMVRREALPYLYFAPMGVDTKIDEKCENCEGMGDVVWPSEDGGSPRMVCPKCNGRCKISTLNRFADIWMGIFLKQKFDLLGWACYTGGSTILHTRASDAKKNFEQEKLGREWNEHITNYMYRDFGWVKNLPDAFHEYMTIYRNKRERFKDLITDLLLKNK